MKFIVFLLSGFLALPAFAVCTFKTGHAVVCRRSPDNAVLAFSMFGLDSARADLSYNKQLLRQADCAQLSNLAMKDHPLDEVRSGRVATPNGWVEVVQFSIQDKMSEVFVARDYLTGVCTKEADRYK